MDNQQDSGKDIVEGQNQDVGSSRRKFTRNALVGTAVLASLANRPAWGTPVPDECVSASIYESYMTTTDEGLGAFESMHPGVASRIEEILAAGGEEDAAGNLCPPPSEG